MKFIDEIQVFVHAGHGGPGSVHFRREKFKPYGGPDGGDGGKGGDVYLRADPRLLTLGHLMKSHTYRAKSGDPGRGDRCSGSAGEDLIISVPQGTEVIDAETDERLGDLIAPESTILIAKGGKGGLGNVHFATATRQAPDYAQPGLPGEETHLILHLKLIADAGFIGLPNAGKSTLLSILSRRNPKIADYPFTTLIPDTGVLENNDHRRVLIADIPGIIEGAHRGVGLGLSFLRHIERVGLILYVIDIGSMDAVSELKMLQSELASYSPELLKRPALIILNKMDLAQYDETYAAEISEKLRDENIWKDKGIGKIPDTICVSALEKRGVEALVEKIFSFFPEKTLAEKYLERFSEEEPASELPSNQNENNG